MLIQELKRMFVCRGSCGQMFVAQAVGTNAGHVNLSTLLRLTRRGWIEYEDNEIASKAFGVKMWTCELTPKGRALLEQGLGIARAS